MLRRTPFTLVLISLVIPLTSAGISTMTASGLGAAFLPKDDVVDFVKDHDRAWNRENRCAVIALFKGTPGTGRTTGTRYQCSLRFTIKTFVVYTALTVHRRPLGSATEHSSIGCIDKGLTKRPFVSCGLIADFS